MDYNRLNNLSLKYLRLTPLGCKDKKKKFKLGAKTQLL